MHDKYKEVLVVLIAGTIIFLVTTGIIVFIFLYYHRKRLQHKNQLIAMEKKYSEELLKVTLEIQEETLKKISDEIHDNIGQILSLAKINIGSITDFTVPPPKDKILNAKNLVGKAIQDLRHLSHILNTDYMAATGLLNSIEHQLDIIQKSGNHKTELIPEGNRYDLGLQKELLLFRIVQEALNNILKHAHAFHITIRLLYHPTVFTLTIADDGKGFDPAPAGEPTGFGLGITNMQKRAHLIPAEFSIDSIPGAGTSITITVQVH